jgi:hypothetical protein
MILVTKTAFVPETAKSKALQIFFKFATVSLMSYKYKKQGIRHTSKSEDT